MKFEFKSVFIGFNSKNLQTLVLESALAICNEKDLSIVYTAMGMAQSKYNIQESISSFFKRSEK